MSDSSNAEHRGIAVATLESLAALEAYAGPGMLRGRAIADNVEQANGHARSTLASTADASSVVHFWHTAGPKLWFAKDAEFDRIFRERFLTLHEAAARGELGGWLASPTGALALLLLLDQFPRNSFRGTPRMYATDAMARKAAGLAIAAGHDRTVEPELQLFFYLPFGHSEELKDQARSVALAQRLGQPTLSHAEGHYAIVKRFGRFPHRNPILGRRMTEEEQRFLDEGGYAG
jgi:uncharacterized protein (DUF924 family)